MSSNNERGAIEALDIILILLMIFLLLGISLIIAL
jgi:hypothetical protein